MSTTPVIHGSSAKTSDREYTSLELCLSRECLVASIGRFQSLECHDHTSLVEQPVLLLAVLLDVLPHASSVREVYHYTSYALAAGVPLALATSGSMTTAMDLAMGVVVPLHFHIGMRSVLADYLVHLGVADRSMQQAAMYALGIVTLLTAAALTRFNLVDMGITNVVRRPFIKKRKTQDE